MTLLADPAAIELECFVSEATSITLVVKTVQTQPSCPKCEQPSDSFHSHYQRTVADLPWHGVAIKLQLHTRKFRCQNQRCPRKVFCERLPKVVAAYARKTVRLNTALTLLALALGGEAGARTAGRLNLTTSGDTLLRRIRQTTLPEVSTPKVVGVDDWAKRKGHTYGTILVDLQRHRPIDLLPDREADTLAAWLQAHPTIEVIARDRSGAYAEGARRGAPKAVQVADRWHLLKNLTEMLERVLQNRHGYLRQAVEVMRQKQVCSAVALIDAGSMTMLSSRSGQSSRQSRQRRQQRYNDVLALYQRGFSILGIARRLKMSRMTVYRYLEADGFPERATSQPRGSPLNPYLPYIHRRYVLGCDNATQIWREVAAQGYDGREAMVRRYVRRLRLRVKADALTGPAQDQRLETVFQVPSSQRAAWWLLNEEQTLDDSQKEFVTQLLELSPEIQSAKDLAQAFRKMVRERDSTRLDLWVKEAQASEIKEMMGFVDGLNKDKEAVNAALRSTWSNGQTEGQVNRLNCLKRQMYGRANFDLLRARVLSKV